MNAENKAKAIEHLQQASDELLLALNIMFGEFLKPYNQLHKAWGVINKAIEYLQNHE